MLVRPGRAEGESTAGSSPTCARRFFFSSRRRHTRLTCDWSSDVCSSDLRNVELPLLLTKLPAAKRRSHAAVALELVGLAERASHKPGELSGGQQQRVAIARAIVSDPMLLVCDEPTGDLDRQSAVEVLTLLQRLNREHGKTIVMVTHDPKAAEYASHTLHLDKGTLVEAAASAAQAAAS